MDGWIMLSWTTTQRWKCIINNNECCSCYLLWPFQPPTASPVMWASLSVSESEPAWAVFHWRLSALQHPFLGRKQSILCVYKVDINNLTCSSRWLCILSVYLQRLRESLVSRLRCSAYPLLRYKINNFPFSKFHVLTPSLLSALVLAPHGCPNS